MSENIFVFLFSVITAALFAGIIWLVGTYTCSAKWNNSGMNSSWGPVQGCLIQHNGRWIPADNFREMP